MRVLFCALVFVSLMLSSTAAFAGLTESRADQRVLGVILAEQQVHDAALDVHSRAMQMELESRYAYLCDWVLPGAGHQAFRLAVEFSPTHPPPHRRLPEDRQRIQEAVAAGRSRVPTGGRLISPALDLIEAARELDRLAELRERIDLAGANGEVQQRCRLAMLGLVDIALGELDRGLISCDELFTRVSARTYADFADRWPETLLVHECLQHEQTRDAAEDTLNRMLQLQAREKTLGGPHAWDHWVAAAAGRLQVLRDPKSPDTSWEYGSQSADSSGTTNWSAVDMANAWTRGQGMPCAVWRVVPAAADGLVGHDISYLFFRSPLRGDYQVECDITGPHWKNTSLLVAGRFVEPFWNHVEFATGNFRGQIPNGSITPRLTEYDDLIRYRTRVRNNEAETYFNGRLIHTEPLIDEHDPWLAIRSGWYADGGVQNLTIRGNPTIPRQIRLSLDPELSGWYAYHGEPVTGPQAYWSQQSSQDGGEIVSQAEPWMAGQAAERLLTYQRPMLENGVIDLEFFHREGEFEVHPAIDRRVFILDPGGVRIHWLSDGVFERTGLSPLALDDEPQHRRGPAELPLKENDWNDLRLTLKGDTFTLTLNKELIYEVPLDAGNQRTLGLFHWGDQTAVRVRNVVWTGDWPTTLPPVNEQFLAGKGTLELDGEARELSESIEHDFAKDGLAEHLLRVRGTTNQVVVVPNAGVRVVIEGDDDYIEGWIAPLFKLSGDFDVSVEFENLELSGPHDSSCGISLQAITEDAELTHSSVYRGTLRKPNTNDRRIIQSEFNRKRPGGSFAIWPGSTAEEATSGTLRLARRGDQLHCLFAEGDSPNFRKVHTETVPTEPTLLEGLRLRTATSAEVAGNCKVAVTWKRLSVRAEKISYEP